MRPYDYQTTSEQCPQGSFQTSKLGSNSITFNTPLDSNVQNPMSFHGTSSWNVSIVFGADY